MVVNGLIRASSPGRICLFGEHLDYLDLPVIAAAINLRMHVEGAVADSGDWIISKPDLGEKDHFVLGADPVPYAHETGADFLRAAINVLRREGVALPASAMFRVTGQVPIQAGTSSSSALQVAWAAALLTLAGDVRAEDPEAIARVAYLSEVLEFEGSGGMMDQFASALGGLVRIDPDEKIAARRLPAKLGRFVLGHSHELKDTQAILGRVQAAARRGALWLERRMGRFSWRSTPAEQVDELTRTVAPGNEDLRVTLGALRNRDLLEEGHRVLTSPDVDHGRLGALLSDHHAVLRDQLEISTPKIDRLLDAAMAAGALGGKINGSGGGGCMFAYAPDAPESVAEAIRHEGGEPWIVQVTSGVEVHADHRQSEEVADL